MSPHRFTVEDVPCLYVPVDTNPRAHCEGFPAVTPEWLDGLTLSILQFIIIIIIMLSRLLFACGASTQFDLQGKPCIGRVKTPVA